MSQSLSKTQRHAHDSALVELRVSLPFQQSNIDRPRAAVRTFLAALLCWVFLLHFAARSTSAQTQVHNRAPQPRILVLRGLCEVFSLGMNGLASKLSRCGYDVELTSWTLAHNHARNDPQRPLVVIGHSLGGRMCLRVSRMLQECGITVPLIIVVDANPTIPVPANVHRCVNLHVTNNLGIFHGSPVCGVSQKTQIVNWDVSKAQRPWWASRVDHFNIDASPWIHQLVYREIARMFPPPCGPKAASAFDPTIVHSSEQTSNGGSVQMIEVSFP